MHDFAYSPYETYWCFAVFINDMRIAFAYRFFSFLPEAVSIYVNSA